MYEILLQACYRVVDLLREFRVVNHLAEARTHVDENHYDAVALQLHALFELRREVARCGEEALRVVEHLQSAFRPVPVACGKRVFCHRDGGESLREHIASLAQRMPLCGDGEVHVAVVVEAVCLDKVESQACGFKPFGSFLHIVVGKRADECEATLEPYRLGRVHQASVAVETGIYSAVLSVETMLKPEGHDVFGEVGFVLFRPRFNVFSYVHCFLLRMCLALVFRTRWLSGRSQSLRVRASSAPLLRR